MKRTLTGIVAVGMVLGTMIGADYAPTHQSGIGMVQGAQSLSFNHTSMVIPVDLTWQTKSQRESVIVDTGSFTTIIPEDVATELNLPYHGACIVNGVTGSETGYYSSIYIKVDSKTYGVPCVVLPSFHNILLGADFFRLDHLQLDMNFKTNQVEIKPAH